ncbi:MAG: phosphoenolpyruvate--protein phosphotransferase [Chloroflexota bacterium]|nr:phosphoenolpyruvate--protein phosphotransferase [Chloroflexota bacterium]
MARLVIAGQPGSPGAGTGRLLFVPHVPFVAHVPSADREARASLDQGVDPVREEARLMDALNAAAAELEDLARATSERAGSEVGAIFEAQALFVRDPGVVGPAIEALRTGASAEDAMNRASSEAADRLAAVDDEYMRERAADLRDVGRRVVGLLSGRRPPQLHRPDGSIAILAADDLDPSIVAVLRPELVAGVVLSGGATNGHAAIVARALGMPLVLGLGDGLDPSLDGARAVLDGATGRLVVEPDERDLSHAPSSPRQISATEAAESRPSVAVGVRVEANVGSIREAEQAAANGADGIGLVRTELLFLGRSTPPALEEQRTTYRRIVAVMGGRPVVFRTLDVGGDKPAAYALDGREANPALGVRGIRLGLRRLPLLETQLRAILEAAPAEVQVMLPMVATLSEVEAAREALRRATSAAHQAGAAVAADVRLGIMVEVPSAALMADVLAPHVDFFSIGTNDLVQYTLAVDRTNPALSEIASPLQPAVLRLVAQVTAAGEANGRPVAVCGEAAADPLAAALFIGLGVTELSVAPGAIAGLRAVLAGLDVAACQAAARAALSAATVDEVRALASALFAPAQPRLGMPTATG